MHTAGEINAGSRVLHEVVPGSCPTVIGTINVCLCQHPLDLQASDHFITRGQQGEL